MDYKMSNNVIETLIVQGYSKRCMGKKLITPGNIKGTRSYMLAKGHSAVTTHNQSERKTD